MAAVYDYDYAFASLDYLLSVCYEKSQEESLSAVAVILAETAEIPLENDATVEIQIIHSLDECFSIGEVVKCAETILKIVQSRIFKIFDSDIEEFSFHVSEFASLVFSFDFSLNDMFSFIFGKLQNSLTEQQKSVVYESWATIGEIKSKPLIETIKNPMDIIKLLESESEKTSLLSENAFDALCVTIIAFKDLVNSDILDCVYSIYINNECLRTEDPTTYFCDVLIMIEGKTQKYANQFVDFALNLLNSDPKIIEEKTFLISSAANALNACSKEKQDETSMPLFEIIKKASEIKPKISSKEDSEEAFLLFRHVTMSFQHYGELFFPSNMKITGKQFLQTVSSFNSTLLTYRGIPIENANVIVSMMKTLTLKATRAENVKLNKISNIKILELCAEYEELKKSANEVIDMIKSS